jgi:lactate dehydrogenase-like 2-hydroxyacid dehydrogenase
VAGRAHRPPQASLVFTPHGASYTEEAWHALRVKTAENAAALLEGRFPKYLFNPEVKPRARYLQHGKP